MAMRVSEASLDLALVLAAATFTLAVAVVLALLPRRPNHAALRALPLALAALRRALSAARRAPGEDQDGRVRRLATQGLVWRVQLVAPFVLVICSAWTLVEMVSGDSWEAIAHAAEGSSSDVELAKEMVLQPIPQLLGVGLPALLLTMFPKLVTASSMWIVHMWLLLRVFAVSQLRDRHPGQPDSVGSVLSCHFVQRLFISLIHGDLLCSFALNASFSVARVALPSRWEDKFVVSELAVFVIVTVAAAMIEVERNEHYLEVIKAKNLQSFEVAADQLLSTMCDAVVHLADDLRISQPSPRLAALLLRADGDMRGAHLLDLLADQQERERLSEFLNRSGASEQPGAPPVAPAGAMHVSLRDTNGSAVQVELFHTRGLDANGATFHVVGVCEDGETVRSAPSVRAGLRADWDPEAPMRASSQWSDRSGSQLRLEGPPGEVAVYVDIADSGFPILGATVAFTALSGPCGVGVKLLEWVINKEVFARSVQEEANNLLQGGGLRRQLAVRLKPPHRAGRDRELSAVAEVELMDSSLIEGFASESQAGVEDEMLVVKILLHNIEKARDKPSSVWSDPGRARRSHSRSRSGTLGSMIHNRALGRQLSWPHGYGWPGSASPAAPCWEI